MTAETDQRTQSALFVVLVHDVAVPGHCFAVILLDALSDVAKGVQRRPLLPQQALSASQASLDCAETGELCSLSW